MRYFQGIILIDVWTSNHKPVNDFYNSLCEFLSTSTCYEHLILPNFGTKPADPRFYSLGNISTIDCWSDFKNLGYNHGDWALGGQSWEMCTHQRELGLIPALTRGIEAKLFSHPQMIFPALDDYHVMSGQDFINDRCVSWQCQPDGFWLAQKLTSAVTT